MMRAAVNASKYVLCATLVVSALRRVVASGTRAVVRRLKFYDAASLRAVSPKCLRTPSACAPPFKHFLSLHPMSPSSSTSSPPPLPSPPPCPTTHQHAIAAFYVQWHARSYALAADYAALAHALALDAGEDALADRYARARQLAHRFEAARVALRSDNWSVGNTPLLEPDDPASSEARYNMLCTPDRPSTACSCGQPACDASDRCINERDARNVSDASKLDNPSAEETRTTCCIPHVALWAIWRRKH